MPAVLLALSLAIMPGDLAELARLPDAAATTAIVSAVLSDPKPGTVLLDRKGPGVLRSLMVVPAAGKLRVTVDGVSTEARLRAFAGGGVGQDLVPCTYDRSLRIEILDGAPTRFRAAVQEGRGASAGVAELPDEPDAVIPASAEPAEYVVDTEARSSVTYLLPPGPRTLRCLEVEPATGQAGTWSEARLRLIWEGDDAEDPAVDLPLGLAFGRGVGTDLAPVALVGEGPRGASWRNRFPMPYRTQGLLRIDTDRPLKGRLRLQSTPGADRDAGFFRAAAWSWSPGASAGAGEALVGEARGRLVGAILEPGEYLGARFEANGRDLGPLGDALGLFTAAAPDGSRTAGVSRWLIADPISYDRGARVVGQWRRCTTGQGLPGPRMALFWYEGRPGRGAGSPR